MNETHYLWSQLHFCSALAHYTLLFFLIHVDRFDLFCMCWLVLPKPIFLVLTNSFHMLRFGESVEFQLKCIYGNWNICCMLYFLEISIDCTTYGQFKFNSLIEKILTISAKFGFYHTCLIIATTDYFGKLIHLCKYVIYLIKCDDNNCDWFDRILLNLKMIQIIVLALLGGLRDIFFGLLIRKIELVRSMWSHDFQMLSQCGFHWRRMAWISQYGTKILQLSNY